MAPSLPDALRLRDLKYGEKHSAAARSQAARQFLEAGRMAEALDLYVLAGDEDGVKTIREMAIKEGRAHVLLSLVRVGHEIGPDDWKRAGEAAFEAHRWREAFRCFSEAGDEDGLAAVRERIPNYEIYTPQGK